MRRIVKGCSGRRRAAAQVPERVLPVRDAAFDRAHGTGPGHQVVLGECGLDDMRLPLAGLEADRAGEILATVEIGGVGDDGTDELGHPARGTALGCDAAPGIQVVREIDAVHGAGVGPWLGWGFAVRGMPSVVDS